MKNVLLVIISIFLLTSCNNKFNLSSKYYENSEYINITKNELNNIENENFLLFVYNNYCSLKIPCDTIFKSVMDKYNFSINQITFEDFKDTKYYKKVKYAPSIIIIKNGKVISYLDANSDNDLSKYQDENDFENWLSKYIYLKEMSD